MATGKESEKDKKMAGKKTEKADNKNIKDGNLKATTKDKPGKTGKSDTQTAEKTKDAAENEEKKTDNKVGTEPTLEEKLAESQDKYLRLSAEFDNYRKRTLKEKMELTKSAGESILQNILPVMDDFDRALQLMESATDCASMKQGIDLIYIKFQEFLKANGIKEIEAVNKEFDTDLHEAITKIPAPDKKLKGKVVDVVQKGYYLNDKIIRYAKVVVGE